MNSRTCLLAGVATMSLAACATIPVPMQQPLASFPFRHEAFDIKVAWKTTPAPQGTQIEGILQNVRYVQILDAEVEVLLLTPDKKALAKGRSFTRPNRIDQNEQARFDLTLTHGSPAKGDLLQFIIKYTAIDDASSSFYWVTSFTVDALTGVQVGSY